MEVKCNAMNRILRNPLLVYESTSQELPVNFKQLLSTFHEDNLSQNDHLILLAYTMMVETGFIPVHAADNFEGAIRSPTFNINFLDSARTMPENWKNADGFNTLNFILPSLPGHILCLTAHSTGSIVVFTGWLKNSESAPSWCLALDCDKYVMRSQTEFMTHRYFNLKDLSMNFKNKIPLPARNFLKAYGSVDGSNFLDLPVEMMAMIISYLEHHLDVINLSKTCVALHDACQSKLLPFRSQFPSRFGLFNFSNRQFFHKNRYFLQEC